ncbi:MAG: hypothetical protein N2745_12265, partial [Syntrophorhabdaceae bacterium]|nr:hypothetical protein [Syntrophorhabdaceae bacterium]
GGHNYNNFIRPYPMLSVAKIYKVALVKIFSSFVGVGKICQNLTPFRMVSDYTCLLTLLGKDSKITPVEKERIP